MEKTVYEIYKEAFEIRMPSWFLNYSQEEIFNGGTDYSGWIVETIQPVEEDSPTTQKAIAEKLFDSYRSLATTSCSTSFTGKPLLTGYLYWLGEFHYVDDELDYYNVIDCAAEPYIGYTEEEEEGVD